MAKVDTSRRDQRQDAAKQAILKDLLKQRLVELAEAGFVISIGGAAYNRLLQSLGEAAEMGGVDVEALLRDPKLMQDFSTAHIAGNWEQMEKNWLRAQLRKGVFKQSPESASKFQMKIKMGLINDGRHKLQEQLEERGEEKPNLREARQEFFLGRKQVRQWHDVIASVTALDATDSATWMALEEAADSYRHEEGAKILNNRIRYLKPPDMPEGLWKELLEAKAGQLFHLMEDPLELLTEEDKTNLRLQTRAAQEWGRALKVAEGTSPGGMSPRLQRYSEQQQRLSQMETGPGRGGGQLLPGEMAFNPAISTRPSVRASQFIPEYYNAIRGRGITEAWRNNVDPEFLKKLQFVHWTRDPEEIADAMSGKPDFVGGGWDAEVPYGARLEDDISAHAYLKEGPEGFGGPRFHSGIRAVGLVLEGDVNFIGNFDIYSAPTQGLGPLGEEHHPALRPATSRKTGIPMGQRRWVSTHPTSAEQFGHSPILPVLDKETFLTTEQKAGEVGGKKASSAGKVNEALLGNTEVVGVVIPHEEIREYYDQNFSQRGTARTMAQEAAQVAERFQVPLLGLDKKPLPPVEVWLPTDTPADKLAVKLVQSLQRRVQAPVAALEAKKSKKEIEEALKAAHLQQDYRTVARLAAPISGKADAAILNSPAFRGAWENAIREKEDYFRARKVYFPDYWDGEQWAGHVKAAYAAHGDPAALLTDILEIPVVAGWETWDEKVPERSIKYNRTLYGFLKNLQPLRNEIDLPAHPQKEFASAIAWDNAIEDVHTIPKIAADTSRLWKDRQRSILRILERAVFIQENFDWIKVGNAGASTEFPFPESLKYASRYAIPGAEEHGPIVRGIQQYWSKRDNAVKHIADKIGDKPTGLVKQAPAKVVPQTKAAPQTPRAKAALPAPEPTPGKPPPKGVDPVGRWLKEVPVKAQAGTAYEAIKAKSPEMLRAPDVAKAVRDGDRLMEAARAAEDAGNLPRAKQLRLTAERQFLSLERLAKVRGGIRTAGKVLNYATLPIVALEAYGMTKQAVEEGPGAVARQVAEGAEETGRAIGRVLLPKAAEEALGLDEPGTLRKERGREAMEQIQAEIQTQAPDEEAVEFFEQDSQQPIQSGWGYLGASDPLHKQRQDAIRKAMAKE